jgi:hypothetical protein
MKWYEQQDQDDPWIQKMLEDEEMQQAIEKQMMDAGLPDEERVKLYETEWSK